MPVYEGAWFQPPAPVAQVTVRSPENGAVVSAVPMLLDTGADVTLVPQTTVDALRLSTADSDHYQVVGFDGTVSTTPVVRLELTFLRRTFRGDFLVIDQPWGVLGRNILNAVPLFLDGPQLHWDER